MSHTPHIKLDVGCAGNVSVVVLLDMPLVEQSLITVPRDLLHFSGAFMVPGNADLLLGIA